MSAAKRDAEQVDAMLKVTRPVGSPVAVTSSESGAVRATPAVGRGPDGNAGPSPDSDAALAPENASLAAKALEAHLETLSLGGGHPIMVVVPRDELWTLLAGYRRYLGLSFHHTLEKSRRDR